MKLFSQLLALPIRLYRWVVSPALHTLLGPMAGCRFTPTCSVYALQALETHGAWRGSALAARRLCRCHPWGGGGADPVPQVSTEETPRPSVRVTLISPS